MRVVQICIIMHEHDHRHEKEKCENLFSELVNGQIVIREQIPEQKQYTIDQNPFHQRHGKKACFPGLKDKKCSGDNEQQKEIFWIQNRVGEGGIVRQHIGVENADKKEDREV